MSMNNTSELMTTDDDGDGPKRGMLHIRNKGMKSTRMRDMTRIALADQTRNFGNAQRYRPMKSPVLNMRK